MSLYPGDRVDIAIVTEHTYIKIILIITIMKSGKFSFAFGAVIIKQFRLRITPVCIDQNTINYNLISLVALGDPVQV